MHYSYQFNWVLFDIQTWRTVHIFCFMKLIIELILKFKLYNNSKNNYNSSYLYCRLSQKPFFKNKNQTKKKKSEDFESEKVK